MQSDSHFFLHTISPFQDATSAAPLKCECVLYCMCLAFQWTQSESTKDRNWMAVPQLRFVPPPRMRHRGWYQLLLCKFHGFIVGNLVNTWQHYMCCLVSSPPRDVSGFSGMTLFCCRKTTSLALSIFVPESKPLYREGFLTRVWYILVPSNESRKGPD